MVLVDAYKHAAVKNLTYLHSKNSATRVKPVTHWVVTDLATAWGRNLAAAAVEFLRNVDGDFEPDASRAALVLAPKAGTTILDVAVLTAQQVFAEDTKLLQLLAVLLKESEELDVAVSMLSEKHQKKLQELAQQAGISTAGSWRLDEGQV